jgi:hypothetical protein
MSRNRHKGREVALLPAAVVQDEIPTLPPAELVVPPRRLSWVTDHGRGRSMSHAVVVGASRSVCRTIVAPESAAPAQPLYDRCAECVRIVGAMSSADPPSVPNLEG